MRRFIGLLFLPAVAASCLIAQQSVEPAAVEAGPVQSGPVASDAAPVTIEAGTHIPLALINSVSTKHSVVGDRVYLQTVFPIMVNGKIAIPPGSYVLGSVVQLKRPGRVKGRGELYVRFESLTLPNGVARDFRGRVSAVDARGNEKLERSEGKVEGDGNVGGDIRSVGEASVAGATVGELAAIPSGAFGKGAGIGAGAGALAGLIGVLVSRGPDAVLAQGSTVEMVLDRPLVYEGSEVTFTSIPATRITDGPGPGQRNNVAARPRLPF